MKPKLLICNDINGQPSNFYYKQSANKGDFETEHTFKIYDLESCEDTVLKVKKPEHNFLGMVDVF
jgi:hypothetical protein